MNAESRDSEHTLVRRRRGFDDTSPLAVVWSGFDAIAPRPVPADSRPVPGGAVGSWGELRERLLDRSLGIDTVDAVWGWLIQTAREQWRERGSQAVLACAGLAVPMLVTITGRCAAPGSAHRHDAESEILAGFLRQVRDIDLDQGHLWPRLRSAMLHVARSWARAQSVAPLAADLDDDGAQKYLLKTRIPHGHPELVLAQAVAHEVITPEAAELILSTRWEQRSLTSVAEELPGSRSHRTVRRLRQRAEHALAAWLAEPTVDPAPTGALETPTRTTPGSAADRARSDRARSGRARSDRARSGRGRSPARSRSGHSTCEHTPASPATGHPEVRPCA